MAKAHVRETENGGESWRAAATGLPPHGEQARTGLRNPAEAERLSEDDLLAVMARCRAMTPPEVRMLAAYPTREDRDGR